MKSQPHDHDRKRHRQRLILAATVTAALLGQLNLSLSFVLRQPLLLGHNEAFHHLDNYFTPASRRPENPIYRSSNYTKFGACLMTKMDNELLQEWLAYHRTILPLTHVVLGSDVNNTQDPSIVLQKMQGLFDYAVVLNVSHFADRHGPQYSVNRSGKHSSTETLKQAAHHALIHRQKGFITTCLERLQSLGVHWTLLVDSDEYLVFHTAAKNHPTLRHLRIPSLDSNTTILNLLETHYSGHDQSACITVPRLLVGSLENVDCSDSHTDHDSHVNFGHLDTLRFLQHAPPGDFATSKFAKVLVDLSRIDPAIISQTVPRNIHRPYPGICGKAIVDVSTSPLIIHHYIGTWERYSARGAHDGRRNRAEWEQRAYVSTSTSNLGGNASDPAGSSSSRLVTCQANMPAWVQRFVRLVGGEERARRILPAANAAAAL